MEAKQINSDTDSTDEQKLPVTIIVNTRPKEWSKRKISFEEVVTLAFETYVDNQDIVYTVSYKFLEKKGTMVKGDTVNVHNEMIFHVTRTDKS